MYVIEAVIRAGNITDSHFQNNTTHIIPAERCTWQQRYPTLAIPAIPANPGATPPVVGQPGVPSSPNYQIFDVYFILGNGTQVLLDATTGTGDDRRINELRLGYISKTGRFVAITA